MKTIATITIAIITSMSIAKAYSFEVNKSTLEFENSNYKSHDLFFDRIQDDSYEFNLDEIIEDAIYEFDERCFY